jgi:tRNA(Ile)-lysidine synthase TilS/MesJ
LIGKEDRIGIVFSGDCASKALCLLLSGFSRQRNKIYALNPDKKIKKQSKQSKQSRKFLDDLGIGSGTESDVNVIASCDSLDNEAENILLNLFSKNSWPLARLGPKIEYKTGIKIIKPLYLCSKKEIELYCGIKRIEINSVKKEEKGLRAELTNWLDDLDRRHPDIRNAIVNSFLKIEPLMNKK